MCVCVCLSQAQIFGGKDTGVLISSLGDSCRAQLSPRCPRQGHIFDGLLSEQTHFFARNPQQTFPPPPAPISFGVLNHLLQHGVKLPTELVWRGLMHRPGWGTRPGIGYKLAPEQRKGEGSGGVCAGDKQPYPQATKVNPRTSPLLALRLVSG